MSNYTKIVLGIGLLVAWVQAVPLRNGANLTAEKASYAPRGSLILVFPGGPGKVAEAKQGLTSVLRTMLDEGPASLGQEQYRQKLFLLNASVQVHEVPRGLLVELLVPDGKLEEGLQLIYELLTHPHFSEDAFQRAQKNVLAETLDREEDMSESVQFFAHRDAFGYSPDSFDGRGTSTTVKNLKLEDLRQSFPKLINFPEVSFWYVGTREPAEILSELNKSPLTAVKAAKAAEKWVPAKFEKASEKHPVVTVLQKAGAPDNQLYYLFPDHLVWDSNERAVAEVINEILGGGLSSRLASVLRSQRGLTYHAGSSLEFELPAWNIWTFGTTGNLDRLMAGVNEVLEKFRAGNITAREIREGKLKVLTQFKEEQELPKDRLADRIRYQLFDRDAAFVERYPEAVAAVDAHAIRSFLKNHFKTEGGRVYLMGDKKALLAILKHRQYRKNQVRVVVP